MLVRPFSTWHARQNTSVLWQLEHSASRPNASAWCLEKNSGGWYPPFTGPSWQLTQKDSSWHVEHEASPAAASVGWDSMKNMRPWLSGGLASTSAPGARTLSLDGSVSIAVGMGCTWQLTQSFRVWHVAHASRLARVP